MFTIYCLSSLLQCNLHKGTDFSLFLSCMHLSLGICSSLNVELRIQCYHNGKVIAGHTDKALFILFLSVCSWAMKASDRIQKIKYLGYSDSHLQGQERIFVLRWKVKHWELQTWSHSQGKYSCMYVFCFFSLFLCLLAKILCVDSSSGNKEGPRLMCPLQFRILQKESLFFLAPVWIPKKKTFGGLSVSNTQAWINDCIQRNCPIWVTTNSWCGRPGLCDWNLGNGRSINSNKKRCWTSKKSNKYPSISTMPGLLWHPVNGHLHSILIFPCHGPLYLLVVLGRYDLFITHF